MKYNSEDEYIQAEIDRMIGTLSKPQQATLRDFLKWYGSKTSRKTGAPIALKTRWNNVSVLQNLGRYLKGRPFKSLTLKDGEGWIQSLNGKAATSLANWKIIVRYFYKWLHKVHKKHQFPACVDSPLWETPSRPRPNKIRNREDVLSKDEIQQLKAHALSLQDRVKIELGEETGMRAGEIASLDYGSVKFDEHGAKVWVRKSKTKKRYVRIRDSVPSLKKWLNEHAYKIPDSPLFYGQRAYHGRRLGSKSFSEMLKACAKRAGIDQKRVWWHNLRHAAVTSCRTDLLMDSEFIARRHGITPATVRGVYLHYDDTDADREYLLAKNGESETDKLQRAELLAKTAPKKCPKCEHLSPANYHFCDQCGEPIDLQGAQQKDDELREQMAALIARMATLEQLQRAAKTQTI